MTSRTCHWQGKAAGWRWLVLVPALALLACASEEEDSDENDSPDASVPIKKGPTQLASYSELGEDWWIKQLVLGERDDFVNVPEAPNCEGELGWGRVDLTEAELTQGSIAYKITYNNYNVPNGYNLEASGVLSLEGLQRNACNWAEVVADGVTPKLVLRSNSTPDQGAPDGGNTSTGTPVTVNPTTSTASIPSGVQNCSGSTYGDSGDLPATNTPVHVSGTNVTALTLRFEMGVYFGEPTRKAVVSWEGNGALSSVQWLAEVHDSQGRQYVTGSGQRVYASYNVGSIEGPGEGFGVDSTGSPSWSQTFVTYDNTSGVAYGVSETEAKNVYKACFNLAQVRLVRLNGSPALK